MSYRLPNLNVEQYRLLSADEQYLLISSIHALYERMIGQGTIHSIGPAPDNVVPLREAVENLQATPAQITHSARKRAFRKGSSSAYIMQVMLAAGDAAALTPKEVYRRVSVLTRTVNEQAVWTALHRLAEQGVLEKTQYATYRLKA